VGNVNLSYGWLGRESSSDQTVGLVVQAAYHLDEFLPLRDELRRRGYSAELLVPRPPKQPLDRFRPGVRLFNELLAATSLPIVGSSTVEDLTAQLSSVVVMNDWGTPALLVSALRACGTPTYGWVEGVQDYADVDTGQTRRPYRHVDHVFCLGDYGADQLGDQSRSVVGSERLRRLWAETNSRPTDPHATVSSNFTYGVLTEHRRDWLRSSAGACRAAGISWSLSRHAAERGTALPYRTSRESVSDLLGLSTHFVGRFSTVCYEALVRGVELVYHNPHGELEPTFTEALGAFSTTTSRTGLQMSLGAPPRTQAQVRDAASDFLHHHLRLDGGASPASLAVDVIETRLP